MRRRQQARTVLSVQEQPRLGSDDAAAACLHARLAEDGFAKCLPSVPGTPRGRARAEDAGAPHVPSSRPAPSPSLSHMLLARRGPSVRLALFPSSSPSFHPASLPPFTVYEHP